MKILFRLSALALATTSGAQAQTSTKLEEVIVTSSRIEMPLRQVGTSVSVISVEEIDARGFSALYDVLRTAPGVSATNTGGAGGITSVQIRGEDGYRTLVLIDGMDITETTSPQVGPRMEHVLSNGVSRVEILRGPQGLMYGADAGGVVNITTGAFDEGFHGDVDAELGRYGSQQLSAALGGGNETVDYSVLASDFETDGFNARDTDTDLKDDDGYSNTTFHGRVGLNLSDEFRLEMAARDVDTDGEYDGCYNSATFAGSNDCTNEFEQQTWRVSAQYDSGRFSNELAYTDSDTSRQDYTDGAPSFGSDGDRQRALYLGSFEGSDALRLVYGVDLLTESLDNGSFDRERDQDGYYLEYQGEVLDSVYFTAGARYDDNEDYGSQTTWRSSVAYVMDFAGGDLKWRAAYGTGFRAPSLYEIATNLDADSSSPSFGVDLQEEESTGLDLGVAWYGASGLVLEANYFDQEIDNLIYYDYDLVTFAGGYLQENDSATSEGVELIAEWPVLESLQLTGNYTYNDTEGADGSARARRPEHIANLGLQWTPFGGSVILAMHVRAAQGAEETDGSDLDDYEVFDLTARWQILHGLQIYGRVENLFDEDYQESAGYNTSGAAAYAGARFTF
jgi:vitamin B12 transporter